MGIFFLALSLVCICSALSLLSGELDEIHEKAYPEEHDA